MSRDVMTAYKGSYGKSDWRMNPVINARAEVKRIEEEYEADTSPHRETYRARKRIRVLFALGRERDALAAKLEEAEARIRRGGYCGSDSDDGPYIMVCPKCEEVVVRNFDGGYPVCPHCSFSDAPKSAGVFENPVVGSQIGG